MKKRKDWNLDDHSIYNRAKRYGLYPDDVNNMYEEQNGKCAICGVPKSLREKSGMQLDHCPETRLIRGLLCTECNKNLMPLVDYTPHLIFKGMEYKHKKRPVQKKSKWDGNRLYKADRNLHRRAYQIFMKYGVNIEEHERMYAEQNGKCAICGTHKPFRGHSCLHIDHCHKERLLRELLCRRCNVNLMRYIDNRPHLIIKAFKYKGKKHRQKTRRKKHKLFDLAMRAKKTRAFVSWSKTTLCDLIVMMAGRPIQEKEINQVLVDIVGHDPRKRIVGILGRICRREHSYIEKWSHNKTESLYVDKHKIR